MEPGIVVDPKYGIPGNIVKPPSEYIAVTPSQTDLTVLDVVRIAS